MYVGHVHPQFTEGKTSLPGVSFVCLSGFWEKILVVSECGKSETQRFRWKWFWRNKAFMFVFFGTATLTHRAPFIAVAEADTLKASCSVICGDVLAGTLGAVTVHRVAGSTVTQKHLFHGIQKSSFQNHENFLNKRILDSKADWSRCSVLHI